MADEFIRRDTRNNNCDDGPHFGNKSLRYDYIMKNLTGDDDYPTDACTPWYHGNFQVDNIQINETLNSDGPINSSVQVTASGVTLTSRKAFDIKHPNKNGWRLRHICLEGPESAVYYRGRLTGKNVIDLPSYWEGLVDPETITVTLTQIGSSQDLIVDKVEWGKRIIVKSGNASAIDCYFLIHGERMDGERLIPEYEGESPADYPGNNDEYSVSGYHYDIK